LVSINKIMNERPKVDMSICKPGQKLRSKHGMILEFVEYDPTRPYPYIVKYPNKSIGTRTVEGWAFVKSWQLEDHDIVEILPVGE
jgi:hypothetical protein